MVTIGDASLKTSTQKTLLIETVNISSQRNSSKNGNSEFFWAFIKTELTKRKAFTIYLLDTIIWIQLKSKLEYLEYRILDMIGVFLVGVWTDNSTSPNVLFSTLSCKIFNKDSHWNYGSVVF